jgi:hypothetical protein
MKYLGADGPNLTAEILLRITKKAGTTCIDAPALDCTPISGKWLLYENQRGPHARQAAKLPKSPPSNRQGSIC